MTGSASAGRDSHNGGLHSLTSHISWLEHWRLYQSISEGGLQHTWSGLKLFDATRDVELFGQQFLQQLPRQGNVVRGYGLFLTV